GQDAPDRLRFPGTDPDRQDALALDLAEDDDVLLALVLEDEPVDLGFNDVHGLATVSLPLRVAWGCVRLESGAAPELSELRSTNAGASSLRMCSIIHCAEAASPAFG